MRARTNATSSPTVRPLVLRRGQVFGRRIDELSLGALRVMERWYAPESRLPAHRHARANLCLVLTGSFEESFGPREESGFRRCGHATLLYRPAAEVHAQQFHTAGARCVTFEPPAEWLRAAGTPAEDAVDLRGWPTVVAMRLYFALQRRSESDSGTVATLARELFAVTANRLTLTRRGMPDWFQAARHLLGSQFTRALRIGDVAATVGVHRVHLTRTFRRTYRHGVGDLLRHLRVEAACQAILCGRGSLSRIAAEVGFSDHSHLTRVFRSSLGLTPRAFRQIMTARRPVP